MAQFPRAHGGRSHADVPAAGFNEANCVNCCTDRRGDIDNGLCLPWRQGLRDDSDFRGTGLCQTQRLPLTKNILMMKFSTSPTNDAIIIVAEKLVFMTLDCFRV